MTSRHWILALLLACGPAFAQEAVVEIETNDPGAHVFSDSTWLGTAARGPFRIAAGPATLRVVPSAIGTWGVPSRSFEVVAVAGDTLVLQATFPYVYRIESEPRARASLDGPDSLLALGTTPVVYRPLAPQQGVFRLEREGYRPAIVAPGRELWNLQQVRLEPLEADENGTPRIVVEEGRRRHGWIDYAAVGTAVAAAAVAVHFKLKADRRYDLYQDTGDPTLRPDIDRFDRYSYVALGTMQVGLGIFAVRMALR